MKTRWQVEWYPESGMAFNDIGEMQPDLAECRDRNFLSKAAAEVFSKIVLPFDYFGCVHVHKQVYGFEFATDAAKTWYTVESYEICGP